MTYDEIKNSAIKVEKYNTNNAWGFGGSYGTLYTLPNGFSILDAEACYRHLPSVRFIQLRFGDQKLNGGTPTQGKKFIEAVYPLAVEMKITEDDARAIFLVMYNEDCNIDKVNTILTAIGKKPLTITE